MKPLNLEQWVTKHPEQKDLVSVFNEASRTVKDQYQNGNQKQNLVSLDISNGKREHDIFSVFLTSKLRSPIINFVSVYDRPVLTINNCARFNLDELKDITVEVKTIDNSPEYYFKSAVINFSVNGLDYMADLGISWHSRKPLTD